MGSAIRSCAMPCSGSAASSNHAKFFISCSLKTRTRGPIEWSSLRQAKTSELGESACGNCIIRDDAWMVGCRAATQVVALRPGRGANPGRSQAA